MSERPFISNRWEQMRALFEAGLLLDKSEWRDFLSSRCSDDPDLAAKVYELLLADSDSSQFLAKDPLVTLPPLAAEDANQGLLTGQTLCGRFKVLHCLGVGGMGQVYEAIDLELNHRIAIKAIRADIVELPGVLSRFKREVYATRKITHPNICRTFDLETDLNVTFLTMELLRGETLAERLRCIGPLTAPEVRELALQVGSALHAAHAAGVVHCDLKPSNVFMTGDRSSARAVVTDFGIARIIQSEDQTLLFATHREVTPFGPAVGTPAYMSPEQFERGQCSPASDIYSFGLILYEALTGERLSPLNRSFEQLETKLRIAGLDAEQSRRWSVILASCLEPDPAARLSNIHQLLDALEARPTFIDRRAAPGLVRKPQGSQSHPFSRRRASDARIPRAFWLPTAVAALGLAAGLFWYRAHAAGAAFASSTVVVLPFASSGGQPNSLQLGDKFTVGITGDLARFSGIIVPSQTVVAELGPHPDLHALRQQLHAESVVQGSVTSTPDGLRVQVELVDANSGVHRWDQAYERKGSDVDALAREVSLDIAYLVRGDDRHPAKPYRSPNAAAEDAFNKGEATLNANSQLTAEAAASEFQQAIDADPGYAAAFERLAKCYLIMANNYNRPEPANVLRSRAEFAARRSVELDGTSAAAYTDLADLAVLRDLEWDDAERGYLRAIQTEPSYAPAHEYYAFFVLTARGRFAEARAQFAYADRTSAASAGTGAVEALAEYYAGRYEESLHRALTLRASHPDSEVLVEFVAQDYLALKEPNQALAILKSARVQSADGKISRDVMEAIALSRLGQLQQARTILTHIDQSKIAGFDLHFHLAALAAAVGDKDAAFNYLDDAYRSRQTSIVFLGVDPLMNPLRSDPRFSQLLSSMNLNNSIESRVN